jgi:Cation transport protein
MTQMSLPYISFSASIGRNSVCSFQTGTDQDFRGLDRGTTGRTWRRGVSCSKSFVVDTPKSQTISTKLIVVYFFGLQIFTWICLIPWILRDSNYNSVLQQIQVGDSWWVIFTTTSFFANVGMIFLKRRLIVRILSYPGGNDTISKCSLPTFDLDLRDDCRVSPRTPTPLILGILVSPAYYVSSFG